MKTLDENKVKEIINKYKSKIKEISAGLYEDWFWTGATIWDNEKDVLDFTDAFTSSKWATPCLRILLITGEEVCIDCSIGESTGDANMAFSLGVLSGPVQDNMPKLLVLEGDVKLLTE